MITTRVFKSGNSQAVRLPKDFQLHEGDTVEIFKRGEDIVIREIPTHLGRAFLLLSQFPDDFFAKPREDNPPQERDFL